MPWTYVFNDHDGDEIAGTFYENELQKNNSKIKKISNQVIKKSKSNREKRR